MYVPAVQGGESELRARGCGRYSVMNYEEREDSRVCVREMALFTVCVTSVHV